jgi:hypothetical protein
MGFFEGISSGEGKNDERSEGDEGFQRLTCFVGRQRRSILAENIFVFHKLLFVTRIHLYFRENLRKFTADGETLFVFVRFGEFFELSVVLGRSFESCLTVSGSFWGELMREGVSCGFEGVMKSGKVTRRVGNQGKSCFSRRFLRFTCNPLQLSSLNFPLNHRRVPHAFLERFWSIFFDFLWQLVTHLRCSGLELLWSNH